MPNNLVKDINNTDITKLCRLCLVECSNMISTFSRLEDNAILENHIQTLDAILEKITSITVDVKDRFPPNVCSKCVQLIYNAYLFQIKFENSLTVLKNYITKQDNIEPTVNTDNVDSSREQSVSSRTRTRSKRLVVTKNPMPRKTRKNNVKLDKSPETTVTTIQSESDSDEEIPVKLHPCPVCTLQFSALELRTHAHTHKTLQSYLNIPATHKISVKARFYREITPSDKETVSILSSHNPDVKLHNCVLCNTSHTAKELKSHLLTHRNQHEYKCEDCSRVFRRLNHLNTHRVLHLKEYPYNCEQCGKGFVIKSNYDGHILTHDTEQELPHECAQCLRRFSNLVHLNRHMVQHTEQVSYCVKYKMTKCHQCLQSFGDKAVMAGHHCVPQPEKQRQQRNGEAFICKICQATFKNRVSMYTHCRTKHGRPKNGRAGDVGLPIPRTLCSVCGRHVTNIHNHMQRHNGEKPHQCAQCGKRFLGRPQLTRHLMVHSGDKPFVCSVCAKAFNNLTNLQVHERIHKGDRCHVCSICSKGFLEKSYLKKHMQVHEKL